MGRKLRWLEVRVVFWDILDILLSLLILNSNFSERVKIQINVFFVRVSRVIVGLVVF